MVAVVVSTAAAAAVAATVVVALILAMVGDNIYAMLLQQLLIPGTLKTRVMLISEDSV